MTPPPSTEPPKITALIPSHNESSSIAITIETLLAQTVPFTQIIVIPNGCTDNTADIARQYPVTVLEFKEKLEHKKCEALNRAWQMYCQDTEFVVTVDADTELEPQAVEKWIAEFEDPLLAGSQGKFTMRGKKLLTRLQKAEYALGIDRSLRRKSTAILAGASSCYRNRYLRKAMENDNREGPWSYESLVEDYELTYQLRRMRLRTIVSPTIRAYTDAMKDYKGLKGQRLKWQTGTIYDLMRFGFNKYTWENWTQQILGLFFVLVWMTWITYAIVISVTGGSVSLLGWWLIMPAVMVLVNLKNANRIPERDWIDLVIAGTLITGEIYAIIRLTWLVQSWAEVLWDKKVRHRPRDRWEMQYQAEGLVTAEVQI